MLGKQTLYVILLAVALTLSACKAQDETPTQSQESPRDPVPVEVCLVAPESVEQTISTSGDIIAQLEIGIQPKIEGVVHKVFVREGDWVNAGDTLLSFEDQEIQARLRQAEANLGSFQSKLLLLQAGERPEDIAAARARVEQASASYSHEKAELDRWTRVKNEISPQALANQETKTRVARALLDAAATELRRMLAGTRAEEIDAARADVASAHASLDLALEYVKSSTIRSTTDGLIVKREVEPGERIAPGTTVLRMIRTRPVWVKAQIDERDIALLKPSLPCDIRVASFDARFEGKVDIIGGTVDRLTRTLEVKIAIPNEEGLLKPGMFAKAIIQAGTRDGVILMPRPAIRYHQGRSYVFVVAEGVLDERRIITGPAYGGRVEVFEGLEPGEQVVISDYGDLSEGVPVRVIDGAVPDSSSTAEIDKELSLANR